MKKLLGREPTPEIWSAIHGAICGEYNEEGFYNAIYNAAPALPEPGEVERRLRDRWRKGDIAEADPEVDLNAADLIAALTFERDTYESAATKALERAEKAEAERDSAKRDAEHFYQLSGKYLEQKNALEAELAALHCPDDARCRDERVRKLEAELESEREENSRVLIATRNMASESLAKLKADNERLLDKALRYDLDQAGIKQREAEAIELVELKAENERLREDAERYRWLRDNKHLDLFWNVNDTKWDTAAIDADIDAARKP